MMAALPHGPPTPPVQMPQNLTARTADQHDFQACLDILPAAYKSEPGFVARLGHQLFKDYVFVAVDSKGAIQGFLACEADFFDADGFYLRTLIVRDAAQMQGVGALLVWSAYRFACTHGCRRVFADVNDKALGDQLVQKGGFEAVGSIRHMHAENLDFLIYSRKCD